MNSFHATRPSPRRLAGLIVAVMAVTAAPAAAQPASDTEPTFAVLDNRLREGDTVTVTGPSLGVVRGHFAGLSPETLLVNTDDGPRTIAASDIDRVTRRRRGVVLGTIIGLGVGIGFAIPLNMLFDNEGGNRAGPTIKLLAASTGIGLGIDALIDLPRTVYRRRDRVKVRLAPQLTRGGGGVAMQVTF